MLDAVIGPNTKVGKFGKLTWPNIGVISNTFASHRQAAWPPLGNHGYWLRDIVTMHTRIEHPQFVYECS